MNAKYNHHFEVMPIDVFQLSELEDFNDSEYRLLDESRHFYHSLALSQFKDTKGHKGALFVRFPHPGDPEMPGSPSSPMFFEYLKLKDIVTCADMTDPDLNILVEVVASHDPKEEAVIVMLSPGGTARFNLFDFSDDDEATL